MGESRAITNSLRKHFDADFFARIPQSAGVYFMRSSSNAILYIGKAKSLRKRLRSYRNARPEECPQNVRALLQKVRKIDWELCVDEAEAFRRERELIRAVVPPYNIADAWLEDYLYIALSTPEKNQLRFYLSSEEDFEEGLSVHGCYLQRRLTKRAYSALIRLLYLSEVRKDRFYIPAKLAKPAPLYDYTLKINDAAQWQRLISGFLHGKHSPLIKRLVDALLRNERIPPFLRGALQKDLNLLREFGKTCKATRDRLGISDAVVSQEVLRQSVRRTLENL